MHEAPAEEAENTHRRHLRQVDQTAQHLAAHAENIAQSQCLNREDQTAPRSAAAMKKSSQVLRAGPAPAAVPAPAPLIESRVTRIHGKVSA